MQAIAIVLACIAAAVAYGIAHDQVTARVCVEYFTIGHPRIIRSESPALLGLAWGVVATWWVGAMLGIPLAIAARAGSRPKRDVASLVRPVAWLLVAMAACAFAAGLAGYVFASRRAVFLVGDLALRVPPEKHVRFLADLWAHSASYAVGFIGGLVVIAKVWRSRRR